MMNFVKLVLVFLITKALPILSLSGKTRHLPYVTQTTSVEDIILLSDEAIDYKLALRKSLLFYEAQRSGRNDLMPQSILWRGYSALDDAVTEGYYDGTKFICLTILSFNPPFK